MRKEEDEDQRVRNLFREITKLLPERSKIKTDLLYFKYAPILVMPIPCGLSEGDMELVALLTAMMNDTQANKGWCAHEMGKSISSFEKYVHDGKIPEGIHDQFGHEKKWNKSLIRYFANKKAFFRKLSRKYGINL